MSVPNHLMITRLRQEMERLGINARELSDRANVGRSFVYDILSGKSANPTTKKIAAIAEVLGVGVPYLINGSCNDNEIGQVSKGQVVAIHEIETLQHSANVTLKDVFSLSGGKLHFFHKDWICEQLGVKHEELRATRIRGDAMTPTLHDGDMVLVNLTNQMPNPPGVFMILDAGGITAKRLEYVTASNPARVRILSDNGQYASDERLLSEIQVVGRVVWFSRKMA